MSNSPNKPFSALLHSTKSRTETAQLTLRIPQWQADALLDDAHQAGMRGASMQDVLARVVNLHIDAAGYKEPAPDDEVMMAVVAQQAEELARHNQINGIRLIQLISAALGQTTEKLTVFAA